MGDGTGVLLIVAGVAVSVAVGLWVRTVALAPVVFVLAAVGGAAVGLGALVVQDRVLAADWVVVTAAMALLGPAHIRIVLGRFGPPPPADAARRTG